MWARGLTQALVYKTDGFALSFQLKTLVFNPKNSPGLMIVVNWGQGMGDDKEELKQPGQIRAQGPCEQRLCKGIQ